MARGSDYNSGTWMRIDAFPPRSGLSTGGPTPGPTLLRPPRSEDNHDDLMWMEFLNELSADDDLDDRDDLGDTSSGQPRKRPRGNDAPVSEESNSNQSRTRSQSRAGQEPTETTQAPMDTDSVGRNGAVSQEGDAPASGDDSQMPMSENIPPDPTQQPIATNGAYNMSEADREKYFFNSGEQLVKRKDTTTRNYINDNTKEAYFCLQCSLALEKFYPFSKSKHPHKNFPEELCKITREEFKTRCTELIININHIVDNNARNKDVSPMCEKGLRRLQRGLYGESGDPRHPLSERRLEELFKKFKSELEKIQSENPNQPNGAPTPMEETRTEERQQFSISLRPDADSDTRVAEWLQDNQDRLREDVFRPIVEPIVRIFDFCRQETDEGHSSEMNEHWWELQDAELYSKNIPGLALIVANCIFHLETADWKTSMSCSPVHVASETGNIAWLDFLRGVDAEIKDSAGRTPLHHAAMRGRKDALDKNIRKCDRRMLHARRDQEPWKTFLENKLNNERDSPLSLACREWKLEDNENKKKGVGCSELSNRLKETIDYITGSIGIEISYDRLVDAEHSTLLINLKSDQEHAPDV